jgi:hypothetical protein
MADVAELGVKVTLENGQIVGQQLDKIADSGAKVDAANTRLIGSTNGLTASQRFLLQQGIDLEAVQARVNGTSSQLTVGAGKVTEAVAEQAAAVKQVTDATRAFGVAQVAAIEANTAFDGKFMESRAVLAGHAAALDMDAAAARTMALAQADAIAINAAFDGKFIESRAVVLAHAEALQLDAVANETLGASAIGLSGTMTALAAAVGLFKFGQFSTDAISLAARYQTLGVVTEVVGKNAGQTAGQMATLEASLQRTGISAIESRQNLIKMTEAHIDLTKASQLARVAQDAAVIGNVNSSEAFAKLTQGIQTAQVRVLRTIGINVNFAESYKQLAAEIGKTANALTDDEKVHARTNAVLARGTDIAGSYAAAMNTVGKELRSTERYLEDMKVKAGTAFLPEYTALVHGYAGALKFLGENATIVTGIIGGVTAAVIALGVAAAATAIAMAPITLPIIAGVAALTALGIGVGVFVKQAADGRKSAADFAESLKQMSDAQLQVNLNQIHAEKKDIIGSAANGTETAAQVRAFARLSALDKQFSAQLIANRAAEAQATAKSSAEQADAVATLVTERNAELGKLVAVNAAYGESALAIKELEIRYDAMIQKAKDAKEHKGAELDALNAVTDAMAQQKIIAAENAEWTKVYTELIDKLTTTLQTSKPVWTQAFGTLSPKIINEITEAQKHLNDAMREVSVIGARNKAIADKEQTDAANKIKEQQKYNDDVDKIWRDGIEKITTHGFKSFHNFFEDVFQMFSKLMDRMEKEAERLNKTLGGNYKALAYGSAALAGGLAGYQIGHESGNAGVGAAGGGGAGALAGAEIAKAAGLAGPWGAVIGGFTGVIGGLLGAAKAQHEAAEAQKKAAEQAKLSLLQFNVTAGTGTALELNQAQLKAQAQALFDAIDAALPGLKNQIEREKEMAQVWKDETLIAAQLIAADKAAREAFVADLGVRNLMAAGMIQAADAARQAIASEKELADARKQFGEQSAEYQSLVATQAAEAAKRAADAADVLKRSFEDLAVRALAASGANDRAVQDMQFQLAQERELADLRKSGASDDIISRTQEILALEKKRRDDDFAALNRNAQADYQVRGLRASGNSGAADDLAFALAQQRELETAIKQGLDAGTIAALKATQAAEATQFELAKQTKIMQDQLTAAQTQLQAAQQSLTAVKQLHDSLATFGLSLRTGALSPLSPGEQLAAARSQLTSIFTAARGGDQAAAGKFEGAANTFLQSSRGYNASGAGYTQDFNSVQSMTDALTGQFGAQESVQQQMVDALQKQIDLLTKELDATKTGNASLISAIQASRDSALAPADALLTALDALKASSSADAQAIIAAQSSSLLENRNAVATAANGEIAAITAGKTATEIASLAQVAQLEQVRLAGNVNAIQQIQSLSQMTGVQLQQVQAVEGFRAQADAAGQAQVAAVRAGADTQTIYQLGQIAAIERQRTDANAKLEAQIAQAAHLFGPSSDQYTNLVGQRTDMNNKFIDQINAVAKTTTEVGKTTDAAKATQAAADNTATATYALQQFLQAINVNTQLLNAVATGVNSSSSEIPRDLWYIRQNLVAQNNKQSIPAFAMGGDFGGGLRLVGERGPELEATGASRITSTANLLAGLANSKSDNAELIAEIRALREEVRAIVSTTQAGAKGTVERLDSVIQRVEENTTQTKRGLEGIRVAAR